MEQVSSSKISSSAKQTASLISGKIIALIITFTIPLFLTRYLSKNDYGIFSQFYVVVYFFTGFFSMGVEASLFYFYPGAIDRDRKSILFQTFLLIVIFSVVAVGFLNIPKISNYFIGNGELIKYKFLIIIGILLLMPINIFDPLYVVKKDYLTSILYPPGEVILRLSLVIGFVILKPGLNSIFSGIIVSAAICFCIVMIYLFKEIGVKNINRRIINLTLVKAQLKYSLPFGIAVCLNTLAVQFDKIVCISFLTPASYATYSIAFYGIPGVMQVYDSFSKVHLIKMALKYQENKINEISEIYKSLVAKTYSFSIPLIMIVLLYAKKIVIFLFTVKYIDSVPLFRIYLFSFLFYMLGAGIILRATGRTMDSLKSYVYSCLITLPATYFLIKSYGVYGAMSGALLSIILPKILIIYCEIRLIKIDIKNYFPWKKFAMIFSISLISLIPFILIELFFNFEIILSMICGIIYLFIVSLLEIKYEVFVLDGLNIRKIVYAFALKYGIPGIKSKI
jgi:O-antigen/teichoic acid export membrane protein